MGHEVHGSLMARLCVLGLTGARLTSRAQLTPAGMMPTGWAWLTYGVFCLATVALALLAVTGRNVTRLHEVVGSLSLVVVITGARLIVASRAGRRGFRVSATAMVIGLAVLVLLMILPLQSLYERYRWRVLRSEFETLAMHLDSYYHDRTGELSRYSGPIGDRTTYEQLVAHIKRLGLDRVHVQMGYIAFVEGGFWISHPGGYLWVRPARASPSNCPYELAADAPRKMRPLGDGWYYCG